MTSSLRTSIFHLQAHHARVRLHVCDLESDNALNGIMILADAHKLSQVFRNLISNAIKFTPEGGTVVVRVSKVDVPKLLASSYKKHNSYLQIEVTDTGSGIAKVSF